MTTTMLPTTHAAARAEFQLSPANARLARRALLVAGLLGVTGDALLREGPSGVGFPLFVLATIGALAWLMRTRRTPWTLGACLLVVPAVFFAACFAWRDSEALAFYNMLGLLAALTALATAVLRGDEWEPSASVGEYVGGAGRVAKSVAGGSVFLLLGGRREREPSAGTVSHDGAALVRGLVIATPLLFVFGSLLSAADPVFERLLGALLDVETIVSHGVVMLCVAWVAGGYLHAALLRPVRAGASSPRGSLSLGIVEVGVVLGLLDVLFLAFVIVQMRYLFGGAHHVALTPGLTYAEYARRGFFELVWVAALALPTLLTADGLLRRDRTRSEVMFRALAGALIALLAIVMLSAMQRMRLYQREFGLTEMRLYASVAMGWFACVFAWFSVTVLRGRRAPFAFGTLVSAWAFVGALDFANPDAIIARTNIARMQRGERFDASYVHSLSADATPQVMEAFRAMPEQHRCVFARDLLRRTSPEPDWRVWNVGRAGARAAVRPHDPELRAVAAACDAAARAERARADAQSAAARVAVSVVAQSPFGR